MSETIQSRAAKSKKVTQCPGCGSSSFNVTGKKVTGHSVDIGTRTFRQEPYAINECGHCSLLFKDNILTAEEFAAYYTGIDYRRWESKNFHPTERAVVRHLRRLPHNSKILDFGCSSGRLLSPLVGTYECYGFELNKEAMAIAKTRGLRMLSPEELASGDSGDLDALVMVDVFEHLENPTETLESLTRLVRPGGQLIVVTGNGDASACRLDPAQFWYFTIIEHVSMLTERHAKWLAARLELTLLNWDTVSHYDRSAYEIALQHARHLAYWQFHKGQEFTKAVLRCIPLVNRAQHWPIAPPLDWLPDHVVAVFKK